MVENCWCGCPTVVHRDDFKELLLRSTVDGAQVRLHIAEVVDGYEDNDQSFITTACLQFALLFFALGVRLPFRWLLPLSHTVNVFVRAAGHHLN